MWQKKGLPMNSPLQWRVINVKMMFAGFKIPERIVFVDELPRNAMGKVQKAELRKIYADLFRI